MAVTLHVMLNSMPLVLLPQQEEPVQTVEMASKIAAKDVMTITLLIMTDAHHLA